MVHRLRFDPAEILAGGVGGSLPRLLIVHGTKESIVAGQDPDGFAEAWRTAGGACEVVAHSGGHYAPSEQDIARVERAQSSFFGLTAR